MKIRNAELFLEVGVDATRYLNYVKEKNTGENQEQYNLQLAYGYLYQGDVENAQLAFDKVILENIKDQEKYYPIYIRVKTKLLFEKKDDVRLRALLEEVVHSEFNDVVYSNYIKVFLLLLGNRYEEAIALLIDAVPEQYNRVQVVELEYYLAYAYKMFNQIEDALHVSGFIVKKGYKVIYTKLCDEIYEELLENSKE